MRPERWILVIDDNPDDIALIQRAFRLGRHDARLEIAQDAFEGLDVLFDATPRGFRRPPSLVLLDLKMPRMNGFEVLQKLRADSRTRHVPVVVFTSSNEVEDVRRTLDLGANSCVHKPVEFRELAVAVDAIAHYWLEVHQPITAGVPGPMVEWPLPGAGP